MTFTPADRARLGRLADVLIPAGGGMPAASAAGVADSGLDLVLQARPDLAAPLRSLLDRAGERSAPLVVADWRAHDPQAFGVLAELVPGAYFLNPSVREALGYTGQTPLPIDPRVDYLEDGLLESVLRRGPIYRPTPAGPGAPA